jgi:hypothetical protein
VDSSDLYSDLGARMRFEERQRLETAVLVRTKYNDEKLLKKIYQKAELKSDPTQICDLMALNNKKLLAENIYFHSHQLVIAKEGF